MRRKTSAYAKRTHLNPWGQFQILGGYTLVRPPRPPPSPPGGRTVPRGGGRGVVFVCVCPVFLCVFLLVSVCFCVCFCVFLLVSVCFVGLNAFLWDSVCSCVLLSIPVWFCVSERSCVFRCVPVCFCVLLCVSACLRLRIVYILVWISYIFPTYDE